MEQEKLKLLQETELIILEEVAQLCEKHGLTYFLDSGTLIGAIRHNGFIPWDDDIDISMPAPDYCRFLEIAQEELGESFFVQTFKTEDNFDRSYTKVRLNDTLVRPVELKQWHIHHGAWIDIFPMFYADTEKEIKLKRFLYKFSNTLQVKDLYRNYILVDGKTPSLIFNYCAVSIIALIPLKLRKKLRQRIMDKILSAKEGRYLCRCALIVRRFDADCFMKEPCYHSFERFSFRVPNNYDKVLRDEYGDYMQLPPENKRGTHGEIDIVV